SRCAAGRIPIRRSGLVASTGGSVREKASLMSGAAATAITASASAHVVAKIATQSSERHAGTMPLMLNNPRVGFSPTILLNDAGTRPEPAVSVPSAKLTNPLATATAEPELEPPGMYAGSWGLRGTP